MFLESLNGLPNCSSKVRYFLTYLTPTYFAGSRCVQRGPDYKLNWTIYLSIYLCGCMIIGQTQKMLSCDWLQCFGDDQ